MFINNRINLINYSIALLPLSIVFGNLLININILIICFFGFLIFKEKVFFIEEKMCQYLIYAFFLHLIVITLINNFPNFQVNDLYKSNFLKSIFFLRFLLIFLIINKLIESNNLNLKLFIISGAFFALFLSIDIIIQVIFGKNLFGQTITSGRPSGFFGNENIAGNYLQKFILFFVFYLIYKFKKTNFFILFLFILFFVPIILTGNRMPAILYLGSIVLFFLLEKKIKQIFVILFFSSSIIFFLIKYPVVQRIDKQLLDFAKTTQQMFYKAPNLFIYNYIDDDFTFNGMGYLIHFNTGIQIWKNKKIFGHGLKSFRLKCRYGENQTCNTHPHNYFIEILLDAGVIGLILIYSIIIIALKNFFKSYFYNNNTNNRFLIVPFFLITFFEFFPFRSSGSFFTTGNSIIIFLILAIFMNSKKLKNFYKI